MKAKKAGILGVLILIMVVYFAWHQKEEVPQRVAEPSKDSQTSSERSDRGIRLEGMKYTEIGEDGRQCWKILAKEVNVFLDQKKSILADVQAEFYLKNGQVIKLSADKGIFWAGVKDIELSGNVLVTLPDGAVLKTERAIYSNREKELSSNSSLVISSSWLNGQVGKWRYNLEEGKGYGDGGVKVELQSVFGEKRRR
ncbi:MAG: LPS export ABC transporter periplasmic protein LptC [Thermodesulforhabdaceae bacterium]